jgi:hypothetical protein
MKIKKKNYQEESREETYNYKIAGRSKTRKCENTEAQNGYLKGHILKSTQPRIKI